MSTEKKLIPFDLARALAGDPVVNRDGEPVKIGAHDPNQSEYNKVLGWMHSVVYGWNESGKYSEGDDDNDLFMVPKQREVWINLYRKKEGLNSLYHGFSCSQPYVMKYDAEVAASGKEGLLGTFKIIIEE